MAGTAVRILTGAPVPPGVFGIAMQEDVLVSEGSIRLRHAIEPGAHVRLRGTDFSTGETLLPVGQRIRPGGIALAASQGIGEVAVFSRVRVGVVVTGDELVPAGVILTEGMIRDTNSPMLNALMGSEGVEAIFMRVSDSKRALNDSLSDLAQATDLVVVSGGASVGDRDFVASTVQELGEVHFHGVKIRPGKPILFGEVAGTPIFGLPGNPGAVFVGFHIFVREALSRLGGYLGVEPRWVEVPFEGDLRPCGREDFVRANFSDGVARPAEHQGSFGLRSLAGCDCLVRIPAGEASKGRAMRQAMLL